MENELELLRQKVAELEEFKIKYEQLKRGLQPSQGWNAAKESEGKYRALVENSLQGLSIIQDDHFVFCNNAFAAMTGYSINELLALPLSINLVHPEDQATVLNRRQNWLAGEPVPSLHVHRAIKKDGSIRWMETNSSNIKFNGRPAVQVAHIDVTERIQAEAALRQNEKLLNDILDGSPFAQMFIDKDHRIIKWNRALEKYSGIRAKDVVGTDQHWRSCYKEKRPLMVDLLVDGAEEKIHQMYAGKYEKSKLVDGAYEATDFFSDVGENGKWLYFIASAIKDSDGNIVGAMSIVVDVTEKKGAEEELRESREYLAQIINQISDPIFVKNSKHKYVLVNDALCAFEGRSREQLLCLDFPEHLDEFSASLIEREAEVFRTGKENTSEDIILDRKGKTRTLLAKRALLVDKKGDQQIVGVLRDITERKHLEAQFLQAQKMEAIGVLAGGVAHDFNNLLNVIIGYCELVLDGLSEDDPNRNDILQVTQAGQHAKSLTTQLLAFSRKQILQPAMLNLNDAITSMSSMLSRLIPESIDLVINAQPCLGLIYADPGQMQQILMNFVINARDAMPQGGKLTIETANVNHDEEYAHSHPAVKVGSYVMLAISDNGIGMDETTKAHLFEPFFTTKGKGKGTGLGLSTVYGIVKQSNGFIWVYSELGKGTTFKIYFPHAQGEITKVPEESKSEPGLRGFETVLVAEDEASVRTLTCRILRERGYTVLAASNGKEALDIAQKYNGEIHLVLTDVVMPEMGGKELVSRLASVRTGIKALYVSGYTDNAIVHHGVLDLDVAFLQKPFSVESLAHKVREVIDA
jgi:two-component system, cell cycle sensor histidine kinase and response regulator CckA